MDLLPFDDDEADLMGNLSAANIPVGYLGMADFLIVISIMIKLHLECILRG